MQFSSNFGSKDRRLVVVLPTEEQPLWVEATLAPVPRFLSGKGGCGGCEFGACKSCAGLDPSINSMPLSHHKSYGGYCCTKKEEIRPRGARNKVKEVPNEERTVAIPAMRKLPSTKLEDDATI